MPELVDSLNCPKCGGPLALGPGEIVVTCTYCGSAVRLAGDRAFLLRHGMLAAKVDRAGAEAAVLGWFRGGFMKPSDLARAARLTSLACVYVPFYVFEVDVTTRYAGVLTRTGTSERREGTVPRDYFWKVLGRRTVDFPVREFKIPLTAKIPFETGRLLPGSTFLNAEIDEEEAARIARAEIEEHERQRLKDVVDVVEEMRTEVTVKDTEFLHTPLWFAAYTYRERAYAIVLDAATGEVVRGDIPPPTGGFGEFLRKAGGG